MTNSPRTGRAGSWRRRFLPHASKGDATGRICCLCCSEPRLSFMAGSPAPAESRVCWENYGFWFHPKGSPIHPLYHPSLCSPPPSPPAPTTPAAPRPPQHLTLHLTSLSADTCWNEEQPFAPRTKTTLPPPSPLRAVIGKLLKYCDHLQ